MLFLGNLNIMKNLWVFVFKGRSKQFKDNSEVRGKIDVEFIDKPLEVERYTFQEKVKRYNVLTNITSSLSSK